MYELSVACKYLLPRWRQLSVSVISLISVLVIALVVWLIVIFFSVTNGLEKYWIGKFVSLAAPVRVTPTDAYYRSYYYQIDNISEASNYHHKSIAEKRLASNTDPYNPEMDEEIPARWPTPERDEQGKIRDLVKDLVTVAQEIPGVTVADYETTFGNIRLRLVRGSQTRARSLRTDDSDQSFIAQATMIGSLEPENPLLQGSLMPLRGGDITNILSMSGIVATHVRADSSDSMHRTDEKVLRERLKNMFQHLKVTELAAAEEGWTLPRHLLPSTGTLQGVAILAHGRVVQLLIPQNAQEVPVLLKATLQQGYPAKEALVTINGPTILPIVEGKEFPPLASSAPMTISRGAAFPAQLDESSLSKASSVEQLTFEVALPLQELTISGKVPFHGLDVAGFELADAFESPPSPLPHWLHSVAGRYRLPTDTAVGDAVLLPKAFQEAGVFAGDRGYISYYSPTPSSVQEQRLPVYVAGFYDPGMIPMGGKLILVNKNITSMIRGAYGQQEKDNGNGLRLRFDDYTRADSVKKQLEAGLKAKGIDRYWNVETYRNYEFAKEILQQQRSDKNLFMVIAAVIIIVACSNIISMLIILVNDKKVEIGILRSMGATARSVGLIFGVCGFLMGAFGSLIGIGAAVGTLTHLDSLIGFLGHMQGHDMFNPTFYGSSMPNELSFEALTFVLVVTATFSLLAGVVPAIKASLLKPSSILRSE